MIEQLTFSVMTKYFPDGTFRIWSAQNGSFSYHEGKHEADNNFIAGENLNLFIDCILLSRFTLEKQYTPAFCILCIGTSTVLKLAWKIKCVKISTVCLVLC